MQILDDMFISYGLQAQETASFSYRQSMLDLFYLSKQATLINKWQFCYPLWSMHFYVKADKQKYVLLGI